MVGTLLIIGMLGLIAVLLAEAHEWAEARWDTGRRRLLQVNRSSNAAVAAAPHQARYARSRSMCRPTTSRRRC